MRIVYFIAASLLLAAVHQAYGRHVDFSVDRENLAPRHVEWVDPCTDGRFSDGRPRSCAEILDSLDRYGGHWRGRGRPPYRQPAYDPCRDGRISDGRPRTCRELRQHLRMPAER